MPMMALVNPVYDCLFRLAQPDSLSKEEEVSGPGTRDCGGGLNSECPPLSMETHLWGRNLVGVFAACRGYRTDC